MPDPTPLRPINTTPNPDAINLLEEALTRARAGKTVAVAIVEAHNTGSVSMAYSHCSHYHQLNSGAARLATRLAAEPGDQ